MKSDRSTAGSIFTATILNGIGIILIGWSVEAGLPMEAKQLAIANNTFAFDLFARLAKDPGNLVLSPFSIDAALAMTSAGAGGKLPVR